MTALRNPSIPSLQSLLSDAAVFLKGDLIIAGGAIRDILNKKQVADIDIFWLPEDDDDVQEHIAQWASSRNDTVFYPHRASAPSASSGYSRKTSSGGLKYDFSVATLPSGFALHPIQVVATSHPPREVASQFDYGLCQCWLDRRRVGWSRAYFRDYDQHRITYYPNQDNAPAVALARFAKLHAKYSDWPFIGLHNLPGATP